MNDARIIEELGIHGITISPAINGVANSDTIIVEFWQEVRTPFVFTDADKKSCAGKLIGNFGNYFGKMNHRFGVSSFNDAWSEIQRRAHSYQQLEKSLFEKKDNS